MSGDYAKISRKEIRWLCGGVTPQTDKESAGTVHGIAVDEDGEYRSIRRMPHGRHVVIGHVKTPGNRKTKVSRYAKILQVCAENGKQADYVPPVLAYALCTLFLFLFFRIP